MLELRKYDNVIALSENEAYNTLVTTDLAPEFGPTIYISCAVIANTAAVTNCPAPLEGARF